MKCRIPSRIRSFLPVFALAASVAAADQILVVNSDTLTSYLAAKTLAQDAKPRVEQRAVNIDGSSRAGSTHSMSTAGNPFENLWSGEAVNNGVRLDTGTWAPTEVDMSLPAAGFRWNIGRTYNARQEDSGQYDSDGYQGKNWFQTSQPELVFYDDADNSKDVLYLVLGADRYVEFQRQNSSSNQFRGKNGVTGVFDYSSGSPDTYVLTDAAGVEFTFFGFNTASSQADGQLWKIEDAANNLAYVGSTTKATAVTSGYDASARITTAFDSENRRYTYSYTTLDSVVRLTEVAAETKTGGTWAGTPTGVAEVAKVEYTYYTDETHGDAGDLKTVKRTTPMTDSGINDIRVKYYRYWEGTFDSNSNPGHPHALKLIVDYEGARNFDWTEAGGGEPEFDDGFLTASTSTLEPFASAYFEYDSSHRIDEAWFNGQCGCGGAGTGTHTYRYETNGSYTDNSGYDTAWARRTCVKRPDDSWVSQYFDEVGQPISKVITSDDPDITSPSTPDTWVHNVSRNSDGVVSNYGTPANLSAYTHSSGSITAATGAGLYWTYERVGASTLTGFLSGVRYSKGSTGTSYYRNSYTYTSLDKGITDSTISRPVRVISKEYPTAVTTQEITMAISEATTAGASSPDQLVLDNVVVDLPAVSGSNNGNGFAPDYARHFALDGSGDFYRALHNRIDYSETANGHVVLRVRDADTSLTGSGEVFEGITIPGGFSTSGSGALHQVAEFSFDAQGRPTETILPSGRVTKNYYTVLADRRVMQLIYPKYDSSPEKFYGPVSFSITNHAGKAEVTGTIALSDNTSTAAITTHIDETDSDPITAVDTGSSFGAMSRMATSHYDDGGSVLEETRTYFLIPGSGAGTDGTNYDPTLYGYDALGRKTRNKDATGTIRRKVFDIHSRATEQWLGTNDSSFSGGEASGTDDMVKTSELEFDSGNDGANGLVTTRTEYVEDSSTDSRETSFLYDYRGRVRLETRPEAPHGVYRYDDLDRRTAEGGYSSTAGLGAATNPLTYATNRVTLSETAYDERGRTWKTTQHSIDAADGSDDDTLETLTWYAHDGRVYKRDGEQLEKFDYDRLGRETHVFTLASDDDSTFGDVKSVTGDIVLEEEQTTYDAGGSKVMVATIERHHDDKGVGKTTGALDSNADGDSLQYTAANVAGRIQISAMWYDATDRLVDQVSYGTNGGSNFDRDGLSVPARSDTALRTSNVYDDDGNLSEVTDPKGIERHSEFDAQGRVTTVISNYDDGTPGGTDGDEDRTVTTEYTDGLRTKVTADLPAGETDQETVYAYGTTKGAGAGDSAIGTGHLLQEVTYPDSTSGTDVVTFAYNALGEQTYRKDQAGGVLEYNYDDDGRETHRRVSTLASGFDGAVRRISTIYDSVGHRELVTQYDNATVGSGSVVDEVRFTYDGWGNTTKLEQDRNSAVDASGSVDDYEVSYTYVKKTTGRNTVRRSTQTLPSGKVLTFSYVGTSGLFDNKASRVTQVKDGANRLATYNYNGLDTVVGTTLDQPDVMWLQYGSTSGDYPDLDRFNRVTSSRWTKDLATDVDFYDTDFTYDRNSNITSAVDNIHTGFDVIYTNDDLNRLTRAEEGTESSGSITIRTRDQRWTLDQTGNWTLNRLDLNGDGDFTDTDELDDDRTHNDFSELTGRDIDSSGADDYTLTYDAAGNLTDDGENHEYEWDGFSRLRRIKRTTDQSLVTEFKYNGLDTRISRHEDTDLDGDVDGSDVWFHSALDTRRRVVATFRENDTAPKEEFVYHEAGPGGSDGRVHGGLIVARDRDANTSWTSASDGTLEERVFYCQNLRADVVALAGISGQLMEWVKYSGYGVPYGLPGGDTDSDGDCDGSDVSQIQTWIDAAAYDVRGDVDLDWDVDSNDKTLVESSYEGTTLGRNALSALGNRRAFMGNLRGPEGAIHVGGTAISEEAGRWLSRNVYTSGGRRNRYALMNNASSGGWGGGLVAPCTAQNATFSANQMAGTPKWGERWILGQGKWVPASNGIGTGRCNPFPNPEGCGGGPGWKCSFALRPMFTRDANPSLGGSSGPVGTPGGGWSSSPPFFKTVNCPFSGSGSIHSDLFVYMHGSTCDTNYTAPPTSKVPAGALMWSASPNPCPPGSSDGFCDLEMEKLTSGLLNTGGPLPKGSSSPNVEFNICATGPKKMKVSLRNGAGAEYVRLKLRIDLPCN